MNAWSPGEKYRDVARRAVWRGGVWLGDVLSTETRGMTKILYFLGTVCLGRSTYAYAIDIGWRGTKKL